MDGVLCGKSSSGSRFSEPVLELCDGGTVVGDIQDKLLCIDGHGAVIVQALCNSISADHIRWGAVLNSYDLLAGGHLPAAIGCSPGYFTLSEGEIMRERISGGLNVGRAIVSEVNGMKKIERWIVTGGTCRHICSNWGCGAVIEG